MELNWLLLVSDSDSTLQPGTMGRRAKISLHGCGGWDRSISFERRAFFLSKEDPSSKLGKCFIVK
jgi:hypothetical protein